MCIEAVRLVHQNSAQDVMEQYDNKSLYGHSHPIHSTHRRADVCSQRHSRWTGEDASPQHDLMMMNAWKWNHESEKKAWNVSSSKVGGTKPGEYMYIYVPKPFLHPPNSAHSLTSHSNINLPSSITRKPVFIDKKFVWLALQWPDLAQTIQILRPTVSI